MSLRVVHIIMAKGLAGAENHLLDLLAGLRARDVEARFLLLSEPDNSAEGMRQAAEARGIPVEIMVMQRTLDPALIWRLRRRLRELRPDVVHTHLTHADLHGIPAARLAGVRAVLLSHHNDDPRMRQPARRLPYMGLWRLVSGGIAISEAVRRFCIAVEGAPPRKVHTIYYGLPLPVEKQDKPAARAALRAEIGAEPDAPVFGMVCRLMDAKGIPDAINAFARLTADFPEARLVVAGDGPLRDELAAQISALKLTDQVRLLGWRKPLPVIAGLDVLLMPSVREGFGLTMLEAMGQAIPIIGSTASAIPEVVVNGQTGLTVPPRDPAALAAAMRTLLLDKPLRMHFGLLGEERLELHFSAARMVDETLTLYTRLLRR